jgi:quercetin 2,3-dioxygenase
MLTIRRSSERGHANYGWLDTYHSFSFADYFDPQHMGFRALRVINEDVVQPGQGFGMHGHRDMEIITYVLSGALGHQDSMGNGEMLRAGELQRMTAGTGVMHSEFNPSSTEPVHLYQIWIKPQQHGLTPEYEQKAFPVNGHANQWRLVASPDGREGSLSIHQRASLSLAELEPGKQITYTLEPGHHAWLQVVRGKVTVNGQSLQTSDAVAVSDESELTVQSENAAEVMLFDLA